MPFDNRRTYRQAKPQSPFFGREERLKDSLMVNLAYACSSICNAHLKFVDSHILDLEYNNSA
jgi:hypothetical protein